MTPVDLVFLDLDGTCVETYRDEVTPELVDTVDKVKATGVHVAIATGRTPEMAMPVVEALGLEDSWLIAGNGISTGIPNQPHTFRIHADLDVKECINLYPYIEPSPFSFGIENSEGNMYASRHLDLGDNVPTPQQTTLENIANMQAVRAFIHATHADDTEAAHLDILVRNAYPNHRLQTHRHDNHQTWWSIENHGISKATGAAAVANRLGIPQQHTLAIGNDHNDIPLMEWASIGIMSPDAPFQAIEAATHITETGTPGDLVNEALHTHILNKENN